MPDLHLRPSVSYCFVRRLGCALTLTLTLGACGYKGPLYMPPPPPAPDASLTTPPTAPETGLTPS